MSTNQDIAALRTKADFALSDLSSGGLLNPEQSDSFLDKVYDRPSILQQSRFVKMGAPKRYIEGIGFDSRISRAAESGVALAASDRSAPTTNRIELSTKEYIAEVHITYDTLEDNIAKDRMKSVIMQHIATRVSLDIEELFLLGDTTSTDGFLATQDGIIKRATTNVVTLSSPNTSLTKDVFKSAVLACPNKYLDREGAHRFFLAPSNETEYRSLTAERQTNLGDTSLEGRAPMYIHGYPIERAPLIPTTKMLFCNPQNLLWGVQRDIMVESDKDIRSRTYVIVVTYRAAIQIEREDAIVVVEGIA